MLTCCDKVVTVRYKIKVARVIVEDTRRSPGLRKAIVDEQLRLALLPVARCGSSAVH